MSINQDKKAQANKDKADKQEKADVKEALECWDCGRKVEKLYMKGLCAHCYVLDNC